MGRLNPSSHLFELARQGRRLTHIVLAVPLSVVFVAASQVIGGLPVVLGLMALVPGGLASLASDGEPVTQGLTTAVILVSAFAGLFVELWAWLRWVERRPFWTLGFERPGAAGKYLRGFGLGCLIFAAVVAVGALLGYASWRPAPVDGPRLAGVLIVLLGWAVQGAGEEVLMRGWLMAGVGARYGPWVGVLVSASVFALMHSLNPGFNWLPLLNLFLFGLFSALYALREGALWGICAWHAAWNWAQGNVFGLPVSGGALNGPALLTIQWAGPALFTGGAFGPEGGLLVTTLLALAIGRLLVAPRPAARASG